MTTSIKNNKFYNTFTPFINKNTITAEKTLRGDRKRRRITPEKISKSFFKYFTPISLLLVPIFAITVSKSHLSRMLFNLEKEYFLAVNNKMNGGFMKGVSTKFSIAKYHVVNNLIKLMTPLKNKKDKFFSKITASENKTLFSNAIQTLNGYFIRNKTYAATRRTQKVKNVFSKLLNNLDEQLKVIDDSANGKINTLLSNELLKVKSDEIPIKIDFSKTADGKSRTAEIKQLINQIKTLLNCDKPEYNKIIQKITYSCDDVFDEALECLIKIRKELENTNNLNSNNSEIITKIYDNLVKYKYAELIPENSALSSKEVRMSHLNNLKTNLNTLKQVIPNQAVYNEQAKLLADILNEKTNPNNMGLLEKIRILLKCNDIKSDLVKDGINPALFKQYQTDKYLKTKELIKEFSKELKIANKTEKYILPNSLEEINNGKIFTHAIATSLPAGILLGTELMNKNKEKKNNIKRTLAAFTIGSLTMFSSHYFAICSRQFSIIYGLLATFITTKFIDKFIDRNK